MQGSGNPEPEMDGDEEPRLRAIVDHVADGIVIVNREGMVRFVNPSAEQLFGRSAGELLGHPFGFPLSDGATEIDVVRRGEGTVVAELRVAEMEWEGEAALLVSLRDVTDRRDLAREQAARARAEDEEKRSRFLAAAVTVLDSSLDYGTVLSDLARLVVSPRAELRRPDRPDAPPRLADWCVIDVVEGDGSLHRVAAAHHDPARAALVERLRVEFPPSPDHPNPATEAMRSRQAVLYRHVSPELLASVTRGAEHAALLRELGTAAAMAIPLVARGTTLGAIVLACGEGRYTDAEFALARDLAQRAALSISNARLYREAQEANRAKSDFLAVMSHELRTPLNAVLGYADLLDAEISGPINDQQRAQLARITDASHHLLQIVEEILTYARMEAGREELHGARVELGELVGEVTGLVRPLAERKGLAFEVRDPPRPAELETDPGKARQILLNLLSNAVKFTERGSVRVEVLPDGEGHLIRVADTGIGIAPELLERIYDPFWQVQQSTNRTAGGTGLGLSVARRLADLLGGSLRAESAPGQGSTFTLWLPRGLPGTPS